MARKKKDQQKDELISLEIKNILEGVFNDNGTFNKEVFSKINKLSHSDQLFCILFILNNMICTIEQISSNINLVVQNNSNVDQNIDFVNKQLEKIGKIVANVSLKTDALSNYLDLTKKVSIDFKDLNKVYAHLKKTNNTDSDKSFEHKKLESNSPNKQVPKDSFETATPKEVIDTLFNELGYTCRDMD